MTDVCHLNLERNPHEFQRIYLPKRLLLEKCISLRSIVRVHLSSNGFTLCKAFLQEHELSNFYKIAPTVHNKGLKTGKGYSVSKVEPLGTCRIASHVELKLICKDVATFVRLRSANGVEKIVYDIFKDISFLPGYFVQLENHLVAKLYGISGAIIESVNGLPVSTTDERAFEIQSSTSLSIHSIVTQQRYEYLEHSLQNLPSYLGGLMGQMNECEKVLLKKSKNKKGVLLFGPSGSGKTTCLRQACNEVKALLITVNANEFFGSREGESEGRIRSIFQNAQLHAKEGLTILYIQYIELLNDSSADRNTSNSLNRSLLQLVSILDDLAKESCSLIVFASAHDVVNVHQALRRPGRLDYEISFGVPKFSQRLDIISNLLPSSTTSSANWLAEMTPGYLPADLGLLISHAKMEALQRSNAGDELIPEDLSRALKLVSPSGFKGGLGSVSTENDNDLNSIRGLEDVKTQLRRCIQWPLTHPEAFARLGIKIPRGLLLYGPPGCGKTSLARAFSKDGGGKNVSFLSVSGASIYSPYVGDSEKNIVEVFRKARLGAPCLLFIDEIDTLVSKRGQKGKGDVQERILSTLLNEMDGLENLIQAPPSKEQTLLSNEEKEDEISTTVRISDRNRVLDAADVIVIGATNRPEVLDAALVRPGRFDAAIYVPLPDYDGRLDILRHKTSRIPLTSDVDLNEIALNSEYLSGADLEAVCREAALEALTAQGLDECRDVSMEHFRKALKSIRPSISNEMLKKYEELNKELAFRQKVG